MSHIMTDEQRKRDDAIIDEYVQRYGPIIDMPDSIFYAMQQVREIAFKEGL